MTVETGSISAAETFSNALKEITWDDHEKAEYTDYLQAMLGGKLTTAGYTEMVAQHYFAYIVLEEAAEKWRNDPVGGPFVVDALNRVKPLEADLQTLLGDNWLDQIKPNEATKEYIDRMRDVCFDWAGGYIAHAYTRYLGDLSGGQILKSSLERAYNFKNNEGVEFYEFKDIPNYHGFKEEYRDLLNQADWTEEEQKRVIDEALVAYQLNTKVLVEIGQNLPEYLIDPA